MLPSGRRCTVTHARPCWWCIVGTAVAATRQKVHAEGEAGALGGGGGGGAGDLALRHSHVHTRGGAAVNTIKPALPPPRLFLQSRMRN
ncbi:unnamed protein product [Schistocephalus solidus]|uniref:Secreted protein n=1 Tax=Schistocephalus solidus TaxID=70667 RepID=A0A183T4W2_SCHSO|nr:unnamed protein product [Schistocephalus solidus]